MNYERLTEGARFLERSTPRVTNGTRADIYELSLEPVSLSTVTFQICPFRQSESPFLLTQLV